MDKVIISVLSGAASPSEENRLRRWRAESAENEAYFVDTERVWSATERAARPEFPALADADAIMRAAEARRVRERSRAGMVRRNIKRGLALAASVAAVTVGYGVLVTAGSDPQPVASYATEAGAPRTITLDDGSLVRLAAGSRLEQWAPGDERRVSLTGRAFFAVAHDPTRPFVVQTAVAETRVLGTRFELAEGDGLLRTVVVDGLVEVSNSDGLVEVPAGSVARTSAGQAPNLEPAGDVYALLDWPGGMLLFEGTPLARVAEEVARHFGRAVEVRGEELQALRISAHFLEEAFDDVVQSLCDVAGVSCTVTDDGAAIGPRG